MRNYYQTSLYVKSILSLLFALWVAYPSTAQAQTPTPSNGILYVNKNVTGGNGSGNSWANAIPELADALKWARTQHDANNSWLQNDSLQIYVAKGNYKPLYNAKDGNYTTNANRENAFVMVRNVQLYGGFDPANGVTNLNHTRDFSETTGSILSGDFNDDDVITGSGATLSITNNTENAYYVVISAGNNGSSLIDGFSITGGNASNSNGTYVNLLYVGQRNGGGIYNVNSSPNLTNVSLTGNAANSGGGMYNFSSSPNLTNVSIVNNTANQSGGGMYNNYSSPSLTNVTIANNTADVDGGGMHNNYSSPNLTNVSLTGNKANIGGGMCNTSSASPNLTNVTIANNTANADGGGMYNLNSSPSLTNITIANNTASQGGGMYNTFSASPIINNSIVWGAIVTNNGNYTANHSLIEGDSNTVNGNVDATGLSETDIFKDHANADYSLKDGSIAIDAGDNTAYTNAGGDLNNDTDLVGNTRLFGSSIDIGAYENQPVTINPSTNNILYVNKNVTGGNGSGNSWANAIPELADALKWARTEHDANNSWLQNDSLQIYVAKGNYKPLYSAADGNYTNNANRENAFVMVKNVQLYGGFDPANDVTNLNHTRDFSEITGSVLSGDFNDDDVISGSGATLSITNNTENAHHVVISADDIGNALIDGFSLTGGNTNGSNNIIVNGQIIKKNYGGGMSNYNYSSPNLTNVTIANNTASWGAGMSNYSYSSPSLTNVTILNNIADYNGGGVLNNYSSPSLTNVNLTGNAANSGGGMYNHSSSPSLTNVTILNNIADYDGGGVFNNYSSPSLTNVSLTGNAASNDGGGMSNYNYSSPSLTNVTIANNTATNGGGMHNSHYSGQNLTNVSLTGNAASNDGGGM
ncbi:beta strand repeat-containing protein, partial [Mesonia hippocampi]|uniref:beta strand repeat-containing protein n=1 Tax=Mesonia hippocampi TaxID=1628250 RepID=UPI003F9AFAEB